MDPTTACRVCLNHEDNLFQIREFTDQFYEVTGIRLFFDALICPTCIGRLHEAYAFREQAIYADNTLKRLGGEDQKPSVVVKPKKLTEPVNEEPSIAKPEYEPEANFIKEEPLIELCLEAPDDFSFEKEEDDDFLYIKEEEIKVEVQSHRTENKFKRKHVRPKEADEFRIKGCPYCFDEFYQNCTLTVLKKHINAHVVQNGGYECDHCNRKFKSKKSIKGHLRRVFRVGTDEFKPHVSKFECRHCGKLCLSTPELSEHLKESHQEIPGDKFKCNVCNREFKKKQLLRQHQQIHDNKEYTCSVCGKVFNILASYKAHEMRHVIGKPFICSTCGKCFSTKAGLQEHETNHITEKNFKCNLCGKFYRTPRLLKCHLETHVEEPQYMCPYCGKDYKQRSSLREHLFTHTGKRTFTCDICGTNFTANRSLTRHLKKAHDIVRD